MCTIKNQSFLSFCVFSILAFIVVFGTVSCGTIPDASDRIVSVQPSGSPEISEVRTARSNGVSFEYSTVLSSAVRAEEQKEVPLEFETDKPDSVVPKHVAFYFGEPYSKAFSGAALEPVLRVFPIDEYRRVLRGRTYFEKDLAELKALLARRPELRDRTSLPIVKYTEGQFFQARAKYVDFDSGAGIIFLTQFGDRGSIINNEGLVYMFQAVTKDGRYYILGWFPAAGDFLPENAQAGQESFDERTSSYGKEAENKYDVYVTDTVRKMNIAPAESFKPSLAEIDRIANTLRIE